MSAEGKKKRGLAGAANAKSIAFRYGGSKCDFSTHIGGTTHPRLAGARMLNTLYAAKLLFNMDISHRLERAADATIEHMALCHGNTKTGAFWAA